MASSPRNEGADSGWDAHLDELALDVEAEADVVAERELFAEACSRVNPVTMPSPSTTDEERGRQRTVLSCGARENHETDIVLHAGGRRAMGLCASRELLRSTV